MPLTIPVMAIASTDVRRRLARTTPPEAYFVVSAVFHYLGPAFAVLLFARVDVLGVAWLRIASAALVLGLWRRPWRAFGALGRESRRNLLAWGTVLAVIALAAAGVRDRRNALALALAVPGVYLLTGVRLEGEPLGVAFAFANALMFALYIVLAHRVAQHGGLSGIDG